jgi:hypothetical protein
MTASNGKAEWHGSVESGAGTITVGRYTAALDTEERAAEVYASLVRRVGDLASSDGDLAGPLAA